MDYLAVDCKFEKEICNDEILAAMLGEIGYESFVDNETGFVAYISEEAFNDNALAETLKMVSFKVDFTVEKIADRNWNAEWESNYPSVDIDKRIRVRAPFHEHDAAFEYEIEILPQMSFGTAHHETTYLMLEHLYASNLNELEVLDMGCGTSVLAIFAIMRGAKHVDAIDIDEWAYKNSFENADRNAINSAQISIYQGGKELLNGKHYDFIIANINRNILLDQIKEYSQCLSKGRTLLMSGFYVEDMPFIEAECVANGLKYISHLERNNWVAVKFIKE